MTNTNSNIQTKMVSVSNSGKPMDAYLAQPDGDGPFPGVVVIHEILGLNDNIRNIAHRFVESGYVALAVDLFSAGSRVACMARIFYGILIRPLKNGMVANLQAAMDFLQAQPVVDSNRIGAIGFCMGGSYALQLACVNDDLRAASVFYGLNPRPLEAVAQACPIVGSYPEKDFTAKAARKLEPLLARYEIPYDIKIYPGARHSFFNDQMFLHHPDAATDSWARTLAFFKKHLAGETVA